MRKGWVGKGRVGNIGWAKIKANAVLESNGTYYHVESEVKKMLAAAKAKDAEEDKLYGKDKRSDELPEELQDRGKRLARLK